MEKSKAEARKFFDSLSDDELILVLEEAGFEVEQVESGKGEVIFTDDFKQTSTVTGEVNTTFYPIRVYGEKAKRVFSFPKVC